MDVKRGIKLRAKEVGCIRHTEKSKTNGSRGFMLLEQALPDQIGANLKITKVKLVYRPFLILQMLWIQRHLSL
jgi:hypothetical protein